MRSKGIQSGPVTDGLEPIGFETTNRQTAASERFAISSRLMHLRSDTADEMTCPELECLRFECFLETPAKKIKDYGMRSGSTKCLLLQCAVTVTMLMQAIVSGQDSSAVEERMVGDTPVSVILESLGAKLEDALTPQQREDYLRVFRLVDRNNDQRHSKEEYVENGNYLSPESRRAIFSASDSDHDGFVTRAEYLLNRIITDEAKAIVQSMDDDKDGMIQSAEFLKHATANLGSANLARDVFAALDTNANGEIVVPEYLRVWGR